jgi:hypothetical protein
MCIRLDPGVVTLRHADSDENKQIFIAAHLIWGLKPDKLPQAKFDELEEVLRNNLTRKYWPYEVSSRRFDSRNVFVISMDFEVMGSSFEKSPCSLDTCMVTNAAYKCGRCKEAIYCCRDHQRFDWKRHKVECIEKK